MTATRNISWVEIDKEALRANAVRFRDLAGPERRLMAVVKANAYGHGMLEVSRVVLGAGVDWLGVFTIEEGLTLREAGIAASVLVLGPPHPGEIVRAGAAGLTLTATSLDTAAEIARSAPAGTAVHLEVETGTNRLGMNAKDLLQASELLAGAGQVVEGAFTHFADIEDTTDHRFAELQLARFNEILGQLEAAGLTLPLPHTACSAAAILFPDTYFEMLRVGIALYGLWPSRETLVSARSLGRNALDLEPVLTWKTRIVQVKEVADGEFVGYGRTFRTTRPSRIALLPVGYADGYDRALSGAAHVLCHGVRAPVRGRVCMNLTMVDVTDVPNAAQGDEVVLLGRQGEETVSADDLARYADTINYEIVTRIAPTAPRLLV